MDKTKIKEKIIAELQKQLDVLQHSVQDASEESFQETNVPLSQVDHRSLEASLFARAQSQRADKALSVIEVLKNLPIKEFTASDDIQTSAIVELEHSGRTDLYFLAPLGAGTIIEVEGREMEVITTNSPLGEELLDKRVDDDIWIESPKGVQEFKIKKVA